jgi:hypothetical protein
MTDPAYRHVVLIIDRSGSMCEPADGSHSLTKADLANTGLQEFFQTARLNPLRTSVSLYQFDDHQELVAGFVGLDAQVLADYKLWPRGRTALLDAVGHAITETGELLESTPEDDRPCEVTCLIVTDGHENVSKEYKLPRIREMITHQQQVYDWRFVYLGAEPDSFDQGIGLGVSRFSTTTYLPGQTVAAYSAVSSTLNTASVTASPPVFTPADRSAMNDEDA